MKIVNVVLPVVVEDFGRYRTTVEYYRRLLGLPVRAEFQHAGMSVSSLGPIVIVGAQDTSSLEIPRQVTAILVVDNLEEAWLQIEPESEVLVAPEPVPSGGRFVVRHLQGERKVIEYLDLRTIDQVLAR